MQSQLKEVNSLSFALNIVLTLFQLKADWTLLSNLRSNSGFGWDQKVQVPTAPDHTWEEIIQVIWVRIFLQCDQDAIQTNSKYAKFRDKPWVLLQIADVLFAGSSTTGAAAVESSSAAVDSSSPPDVVNDSALTQGSNKSERSPESEVGPGLSDSYGDDLPSDDDHTLNSASSDSDSKPAQTRPKKVESDFVDENGFVEAAPLAVFTPRVHQTGDLQAEPFLKPYQLMHRRDTIARCLNLLQWQGNFSHTSRRPSTS